MSDRRSNNIQSKYALAAILFSYMAVSTPALAAAQTAAGVDSSSKTIGLVLTDLRYALHESPEMDECPEGLQVNEITQFKALPDQHERLSKWSTFQNRGPNGENPNFVPLAVEDSYPFRELQTSVGHGFELEGRAQAQMCPYEPFTNTQGEPVDNQMARVLGCVMGWRTTGFMAEFYSNEVETNPLNRHLVEITGVDDMTNDPSVEVAIYKGRDRLIRTSTGSFIPFLSHRVDDRFPQYMFKTTGRIENGVLITDPIPLVRMPMYVVQITGERQLRDMQLRLKLTEDGAEGYLGGFEVLDTWWSMHSKGPGVGSDVGRFSPAAVYRAALRYADGYPDPDTGQCTAISTMYKVSAVRAMIVHEPSPHDAPGYVADQRSASGMNTNQGLVEVNVQ